MPVIYALPLNTNLVAAVTNGGEISLLFYAADNQIGYLFNSHEYGRGNEPIIQVIANPVLEISSGYFTNANFHLNGVGPTNSQFNVQVISDVTATNWLTIGTATSDGMGAIQFNDTNAVKQGERFYRLTF